MKNHTTKFYIQILLASVLVFFCFGKPVSGYAIDIVNQTENLSETRTVCIVLLEPLQPGKSNSTILKMQCGNSTQLTDFAINTTYFIANFYDKTNYESALIYYYGSSMCSSSISYGVSQVSASVDNRISSGSGYSGCNNIYVYDLPNYAGDSASCFANCSSFGALNDRVSSWKVTN
ncbi:MAG: hypothetical protein GX457_18325 [Thermotogaceae bacterium]|nr:hypothetical protein [Thermotogaceae bacterium]